MDAIVLCGVQGSGKSSYVRQAWFDTHVRINLDMLRTKHREDALLHACLAAKIPIVVDNTNPTAAQRSRYLALIRASGYTTATLYFFDVPVDAALARNAARPEHARVPDVAVRGTARKLERPTSAEGWDRIVVVRIAEDGGFVVEEPA